MLVQGIAGQDAQLACSKGFTCKLQQAQMAGEQWRHAAARVLKLHIAHGQWPWPELQ